MQDIVQHTKGSVSGPSHATLSARLLDWLLKADRRYRDGRHLARLTDEQLDDVGLSRSDFSRQSDNRR